MNNTVLQASQLTKSFNEGLQAVDVLKNVNLSIMRGEFVAIVGSSGSGKSTLLHILGGLDVPTKMSLCPCCCVQIVRYKRVGNALPLY